MQKNHLLKINEFLNGCINTFLKNNLTVMSVSKYVLLKNLSYMKEFFCQDFENIPIVHATVDLDKFSSIDRKYTNKKDVIIGSVGRLNWAKGYDGF